MEEYGSRDGNAHFRSRHPQGGSHTTYICPNWCIKYEVYLRWVNISGFCVEEYGSRDGNAQFRSRHPQGVVTPHTSVKVGVLNMKCT